VPEFPGVQHFFRELRRRKVVRVTIIYAVVAWVLLQVADLTFEPLRLPGWALTLVVMLAILGLPIAAVMAWALEATPQGIRRERDQQGEQSTAPHVATADTTDLQPSIAVLPFFDMSPERDQDYFCEGMAEEILNALTRIDGLRVVARSSSFQFKGPALDVRKVGKELGARTVLEGSVRKAGSQLRVTAQLVSAGDGYHLWSERYDGGIEDVFAIQDGIAAKIVGALKLKLTPQERDAIQAKPTEEIQAYEYYLRGRQFVNQLSKRRMTAAMQMFDRAIEIDPTYVPAYAGLTTATAMMHMYWDADESLAVRAEWASAKAIELDPNSADAHASRGLSELLAKRFDAAEQAFERAIALNPRSFDAHYYYARCCASRGNTEKAVALFEKAAAVRPEDYQSLILASQFYYGLGRMDDARSTAERGVERARRALELDPGDMRALTLGPGPLRRLGRVAEAREWSERSLTLEPDEPAVLYNVACFYTAIGELDRAMDLLERNDVMPGIANRAWVEHDPDLDPLRELPRFKAFVATLK
jgi:TolB-like protein/Flp pilus assembly protein TadD